MSRTLVTVAQRAEARFFLHDGPGEALQELARLEHPASRAHGRDLQSDRPGRVHERVGQTRHAMEVEETPKEREASNFAREVAAQIASRRVAGEFDHVILVAEPSFLGLLRSSMDAATAATVSGEVHKELTQNTPASIAGYLKDMIRVA